MTTQNPHSGAVGSTPGADKNRGYLTAVGSLCSGYGGLELGLLQQLGAGEVAWHAEVDKHANAVLETHWPGVPNLGDITTTDWTDVPPVDWMTAGYPCQPFSHAGKRKGSKDERHLWPTVAHAVGVLRPRRVLLENVAGHVSLGLDAVLADLAALGYDCRWGVVRAADAGAPHGRGRVFIVASDTKRVGEPGRGGLRDVGGEASDGTGEGVQRERHRDAADDSCAATADARVGQLTRPAAAGNGLLLTAERGAEPAADPDRGRRRRDPQQYGDQAPRITDRDSCGQHADGPAGAPVWGAYEPAVRRWEHITGRPAPRPTEPGRTGERLSPRFVEWLMGLPAGWVTDVPIPRNAQLRVLGNGVVPQQAALACRVLITPLRRAA